MKHQVLITDSFAESGVQVLRAARQLEVTQVTGLDEDALAALVADADAWIVRSGTKVTAKLIQAAAKLRVIGRAGIGVDNIDVAEATRRGVVVMNTPTGNNVTTAEHTIALLLAAARRVSVAAASLKNGHWERSKFVGTELTGKTLGVIGLGNIGRIVCDRALGLRMKVVAHDPFVSSEAAQRLGVRLVDMDSLLSSADAITVHVPATPATRGLIDAVALAKTRSGLIVINCARGGIVDEEALADALDSGHVSAAGVDVFGAEPPPPDHRLLAHERVVATPHLGASTGEAQEAVAVGVAEQVRDYLLEGVIKHAVNVPSVSGEALARLGPLLRLAERIGSLLAQLQEGRVDAVEICLEGDLSEGDTKPVKHALLAGLLKVFTGDVNPVNAPIVAADRGLSVSVTRREQSKDFASLLTVRTTGPGGERLVSGTVFGADDPRIVRIDKFHVEVVPEGELLLHRNEDRPGVIGAVGTLLGAKAVNVSRLHVGLDSKSRQAIALWNVDSALDDDLLADVGAVPGMTWVSRVVL